MERGRVSRMGMECKKNDVLTFFDCKKEMVKIGFSFWFQSEVDRR